MYLAINFKENFNLTEIRDYFKNISEALERVENTNLKVIFFPSNVYLPYCYDLFLRRGYKNTSLGAQDVSVFLGGSYTGEISAIQLKDYVKYCIVNHIERKRYFLEDLEMAKRKIENLLENDIIPITCVSESENVFVFSDFLDKILLAYEPAEYIGRGEFCGIPSIEKFYLESKITSNFLYGGSVDSLNIRTIASYKNLSGFLVSSYCLKSSNFIDLVNTILKK